MEIRAINETMPEVESSGKLKFTSEHDDQTESAFTNASFPVVCEEDLLLTLSSFISDCNESSVVALKEPLDHELAVGSSSGKKERKKPKKCKKKKKRKNHYGKKNHYGRQRGSQGESKGSSVTSKDNGSKMHCDQRQNLRNPKYNPQKSNADDGGSDDEDRGKHDKVYRGHYAGLPQEEEARVVEALYEEHKSIIVQTERDALERIRKVKFQRMDSRCQNLANMIGRIIVHASIRQEICASCPEKDFCKTVKSLLRHKNHCQTVLCKHCEIVDCGTLSHAIGCEQDNCHVGKCMYWKTWLQRRDERKVDGRVIYSTTTLLREGSVVREDVDFTFLHKIKLGKGGGGHAYRGWFYHAEKEVEADLAVKEVKKDPTKEAEIYRAIRQNHPNLLGAMAIIKFNCERTLSNGMKSRGLILMERADCTLYDLKKAYREQFDRGLPLRDCKYYFCQILEGLRYLHSKQIVHKDIKDLNMLLSNNLKHLKICDWDLAISLQQETTERLPAAGTPGFAAQEVLDGRCHGTPADIFSAGITFLEIWNGGMYPKKSDKDGSGVEKRRLEALKRLEKKDGELWLQVSRCLSNKPEERPTAHELVNHPCLKIGCDYNPNLPAPQLAGVADLLDFRYIAGIGGEAGESIMQKAGDIVRANPDEIKDMMDQLPKTLPNENIPQSSTWAHSMAPTEDMEMGEQENETAMDID